MILADTSAWVEYDRTTNSAISRRVRTIIADGGGELAVTEPILMEVLAGARDDQRRADLRALLVSFNWVNIEPVADFEAAANLYRQCRGAGVTPRGMIDCLIATIAIRTSCELLAADGDFEQIARVTALRLA